jgi:large subunit ribosomal protein L20
MARVKKAMNAKKKHKKILKLSKGFYGLKSKVFRAANPAVMRSLRSAFIGRKMKKREFRTLWIARISAAARMNDISYSKLTHGLKLAGIEINRKMLSEMGIFDPAGFTKMVEIAKKELKIK